VTGEEVAPPLAHEEPVVSASFSPDGARIVTVSQGGSARVWDAVTGKALTSPFRQAEPIVTAAFSADGERLITVDRRAVQRWDVSFDARSLHEWMDVAGKSPYVLEGGVLTLRSLVRRRS
jgi:WD40 repeat protein